MTKPRAEILAPDQVPPLPAPSVEFGLAASTEELQSLIETLRTINSQSGQEINRQRDLLDVILRSTTDGICVTDATGKLLFQNPAMANITGYSDFDATADHHAAFFGIYGVDQRTLLRLDEMPCHRALCGENVQAEEVFLRNAQRPDGVWLTVNASALRDESGAVSGAVTISRDVTAQNRIAQEQLRLAEIVRTSGTAIAIFKLDGTVVDWNVGAERLMGYSRDEMQGHSIKDVFLQDRADDFEMAKAKLMDGLSVYHYETVRIHRDGTPIDVAMTVAPIHDRVGQLTGFYGIATDIRERKRRDQHLAAVANEERQ
ncbi:MAG: PAS domain-containing protein, partial [Gammaproteobacteria bacterium]